MSDSYLLLGKYKCQLICMVAKLYKFIDDDGKAYALARDHLTDNYGRAFDSIVDVYIKPANSVWRQIPPRVRHALLADSLQFRNLLRLPELDLTEYAGIVVFFDKFKRIVQEIMPDMLYTSSKHVRRTMMNEEDAYCFRRHMRPQRKRIARRAAAVAKKTENAPVNSHSQGNENSTTTESV